MKITLTREPGPLQPASDMMVMLGIAEEGERIETYVFYATVVRRPFPWFRTTTEQYFSDRSDVWLNLTTQKGATPTMMRHLTRAMNAFHAAEHEADRLKELERIQFEQSIQGDSSESTD